jgi:pimeloyl-ACP methyl ester carboxylesterase
MFRVPPVFWAGERGNKLGSGGVGLRQRRAVGGPPWPITRLRGPSPDYRNAAAPGFVSVLNDAGWDILRFDRHPGDDALHASLSRLVAALPSLRQAGYRRVVLAGQSRGGWQSIMAASQRPDLVDGVIATAPAAQGEAERPNNPAAAQDDFRRLLAGLPSGGPRVLVALFEQDGFDPGVDARAAAVQDVARSRAAATLVLLPSAGITGHRGAFDWRFPHLFGGCVLSLVQAPAPAAPRGLRRAPCGGG